MIEIVDLATFVWLAGWAIFAFVRIGRGSRKAILFPILTLFIFFGIPLALDVFDEMPGYSQQPGFYLATRDFTTSILYCVYISAVPPLWWLLAGRSPELSPSGDLMSMLASRRLMRWLEPVLYFLVVSPLVVIMLAPDPMVYTTYGAAAQELFSERAADYNAYTSLATFLSVVSAAGLLLSRPRVKIGHLLFIVPWVLLSMWAQGKRSIVAMVLVFAIYVAWEKGSLRRERLLLGTAAAVVVLVLFSDIYQSSIRLASMNQTDPLIRYANARVDFGRDAVTKLAIYAELYPEKVRILQHRGQSFLFDLTIYVPRTMWANKPWPYAVYVTAAMLLMPTAEPLTWGVTTSILEEAIANVGWLGMLLGPLVIVGLCRTGERARNVLVTALTILVACLFLVLHFAAIAPMFLAWVALIAWTRRTRRAAERDAAQAAAGEGALAQE